MGLLTTTHQALLFSQFHMELWIPGKSQNVEFALSVVFNPASPSNTCYVNHYEIIRVLE